MIPAAVRFALFGLNCLACRSISCFHRRDPLDHWYSRLGLGVVSEKGGFGHLISLMVGADCPKRDNIEGRCLSSKSHEHPRCGNWCVCSLPTEVMVSVVMVTALFRCIETRGGPALSAGRIALAVTGVGLTGPWQVIGFSHPYPPEHGLYLRCCFRTWRHLGNIPACAGEPAFRS